MTHSTRLLVTGSRSEVRLWDTRRFSSQGILAHSKLVESLVFSPTGDTLAVGQAGGIITLWDVANRREFRSWQAHRTVVSSLVFAWDFDRFFAREPVLVSADRWDATVLVWDPVSGRKKRSFEAPRSWVTSLAASRDGQVAIASSSFDRPAAVEVVSTTNDSVQHHFTVSANTVSTITFTPDGKTLIAGTRAPVNPLTWERHGRVHRWDPATGEELPPLTER